MNVEVLKRIIDETLKLKGKEKLSVYYGEEWLENERIVKEVKRKEITTAGLMAVVYQKNKNFKIYFYEEYMFFNFPKRVYYYEDIEVVGRMWSFEQAKRMYEQVMVCTSTGKQYYYTIGESFRTFLVSFGRILLEERFGNDVDKIIDHYFNTQRTSTNRGYLCAGKLCTEYILRYREDHDLGLEFEAGYSAITAWAYYNSKNKEISKNKFWTKEQKKEKRRKYLDKAGSLYEEAERYGYEDAYLLHITSLRNYINDSKYNGLYCEKLKKLSREYLKKKVNGNIKLKFEQIRCNVPYTEYDVMQTCAEMGQYFYNDKKVRDYEISCAFLEQALAFEDFIDSQYYNETVYIMSLYYRDGLGGKEKSIEQRKKYLMKGVNRAYGLAEYELFKLYYELGENKEAEKWRKKAKSHGIKDEKEYKKKLADIFDEKVGIEGFGRIMGAINGAIEPAVAAIHEVRKIAKDVDDALTEHEENKTEREREQIARRQMAREEDEQKQRHEQKMSGQEAINKRKKEQGYIQKKKK